jgi:hypothetical protein
MRALLVGAAIALSTSVAWAQDVTAPVAPEIERLSDPKSTQSERDRIGAIRDNFWKVVFLQGGTKDAGEILTFRRADVQAGAGPGASGTTSTVVSPLLPAIFGVALEDGAITRTVSGTTITFKINPAGLICASSPEAAAAVARRDDEACRTFWKRVSGTASFDTARGEKKTELANLQTLQNQFAGATVRAELLNYRKATGARYISHFKQDFDEWQQKAQDLVNTDLSTGKEQELEDELTKLVQDAQWKAKDVAGRRTAIAALVTEKARNVTIPEQVKRDVLSKWLAALRSDKKLQRAVANAPVLTAEYLFQRPDLATEAIGTIVAAGTRPPSLHTGRVIYAQGPGALNLDFTANASFSFFNEERTGMDGVFRDFRLGIEGKFKLRELPNYGPPTLSFAGLFVHLHQKPLALPITFNDSKINQPGNIGVFQAKLELPTAKNSMRIPLSFTYSNRTELIKESDVRGQIGISFNLDALFVESK